MHNTQPAFFIISSIAGRYRPVSYPDGPITARYRFIKNAYWVVSAATLGNVLSNMCAQRRFISVCAFAQSDQNFQRAHFGLIRKLLYVDKLDWSDRANVQAGLSWAHMSEGTFSDVVAHLGTSIKRKEVKSNLY